MLVASSIDSFWILHQAACSVKKYARVKAKGCTTRVSYPPIQSSDYVFFFFFFYTFTRTGALGSFTNLRFFFVGYQLLRDKHLQNWYNIKTRGIDKSSSLGFDRVKIFGFVIKSAMIHQSQFYSFKRDARQMTQDTLRSGRKSPTTFLVYFVFFFFCKVKDKGYIKSIRQKAKAKAAPCTYYTLGPAKNGTC